MADGQVDLLGKGEVGQNNVDLFAKGIGRQTSSEDNFSKGIIRHTATKDLFADGIIAHWERLFAKGIIRHSADVELFADGIIRHTATINSFTKGIIRHTATKDLFAKGIITHWERLFADGGVAHWERLFCKGIIRHTATKNLQADGYIRWPYRLWTTRRYINGVIDAPEKMIGDAKLEYVIEGVMEDIQTFLFANGITSYTQWKTIEDVPVGIRRATTYGTVASLYSRHTATFKSRVIPSVAPVTVTVKGDERVAMEYWEDKYEEMLQRYLTAVNAGKLLVSTEDEEPIFSMDDIPPTYSTGLSWHKWVEETEGD